MKRTEPEPSQNTDTLDIGGDKTSRAPTEAGLVTLYAPDPGAIPSALLLGDSACVLGRDAVPSGVQLPFSGVSRTHTRIAKRGGEIHVEDLESRNGTFVNGVRREKATVEEGDEIRVGEVLFRVVTDHVAERSKWPLVGKIPAAPLEHLRGGFAMERVRREIGKIAAAGISVLVRGETGTGKELAARALHDASGRRGTFCAINCAAIPSNLLESELFGYKRGAFTGADRDRVGLVRSADGGTLFLDEIGDMPLDAQAKLLRMLETREVRPVGGHVSESIDVRVVCATHRDLPRLVHQGRFRGDLYARIAGYVLRLPPLRDRKEDIFQLTRLFLEKHGGADVRMTPAFMIGLLSHDWPFNVRELESAVRRALTIAEGVLDTAHLPELEPPPSFVQPSPQPVTTDTRPRTFAPTEEALREMLVRHRGNVSAIARELDRDRVQIHRWLRRYDLSPEAFRSA